MRFSRGVGVDDQVDKVIPVSFGEKELKKTPKSRGGISLQSPKNSIITGFSRNNSRRDMRCSQRAGILSNKGSMRRAAQRNIEVDKEKG